MLNYDSAYYFNEEIICPYCKNTEEICHDDGFGLEDGKTHEFECSHCDKPINFTTEISFSYKVYEYECVKNMDQETGEIPHEWVEDAEDVWDFKKEGFIEQRYWKCKYCGERKI